MCGACDDERRQRAPLRHISIYKVFGVSCVSRSLDTLSVYATLARRAERRGPCRTAAAWPPPIRTGSGMRHRGDTPRRSTACPCTRAARSPRRARSTDGCATRHAWSGNDRAVAKRPNGMDRQIGGVTSLMMHRLRLAHRQAGDDRAHDQHRNHEHCHRTRRWGPIGSNSKSNATVAAAQAKVMKRDRRHNRRAAGATL